MFNRALIDPKGMLTRGFKMGKRRTAKIPPPPPPLPRADCAGRQPYLAAATNRIDEVRWRRFVESWQQATVHDEWQIPDAEGRGGYAFSHRKSVTTPSSRWNSCRTHRQRPDRPFGFWPRHQLGVAFDPKRKTAVFRTGLLR
ncbi:hypothetical protein KCP74_02150 [Salmonella enterica subsp. enterica]|nr:hypothetical protein KCP74_02150 [Salmonella enterica subsp. enterica]